MINPRTHVWYVQVMYKPFYPLTSCAIFRGTGIQHESKTFPCVNCECLQPRPSKLLVKRLKSHESGRAVSSFEPRIEIGWMIEHECRQLISMRHWAHIWYWCTKAPDVYQLPWTDQTTTLLLHVKTYLYHSVVRSARVPKEHNRTGWTRC